MQLQQGEGAVQGRRWSRSSSLAPAGASVMQSTCKCFYMFVVSTLWRGREGGTAGRHELNATGKLCPHIKLTLVLLCATRITWNTFPSFVRPFQPISRPFPSPLVNLIYARTASPPQLMHNLPHLAKSTSTKALAMPSHRSHRRSVPLFLSCRLVIIAQASCGDIFHVPM